MKPSDFYVKAMELLIPEAGWRVTNDIINLSECPTNVTETQIIEKANELFALEPMRLLRSVRNQKLRTSDWTQGADVPEVIKTPWATYRQKLRDLPKTANPSLDSDNILDNSSINWPEEPS